MYSETRCSMAANLLWLLILAIVSFVQAATFSWSGRSRTGGDPAHHRWASLASNFVYLICQLLVWRHIWSAFETGEWWWVVAMVAVYTLCTSEGSVWAMRWMLKTERGSRRVGARG